MKELRIKVEDKIATLVNDVELVCGNSDYRVIFEFDNDWVQYPAKTALFVFGNTTVEKPFIGNIIEEGVAIEKATKCYIGVFSGDLATTTKAEIKCKPSIRDIASTPKPPSKDVYNEIIELINRLDLESKVVILDVNSLPTKDINSTIFYRTSDGIFWYNGDWHKIPTIDDINKANNETLNILNSEITRSKQEDNRLNATLENFKKRVDALLKSDETTLDELQEIVDYIKNNKELIDSITVTKVNVADVVDSLVSMETQKPLSANQGKILKELLDALTSNYNETIGNVQKDIYSLDYDLYYEIQRSKDEDDRVNKRIDNNFSIAQNAVSIATATLNTAERAKVIAEETQTNLNDHIYTYNNKVYDLEIADKALEDALEKFKAKIEALLKVSEDDDALNELQEIVDYIKNNKDLIDGITSSKVSISDIVDDIVTEASNRPLSAKQGVVLNRLINELNETLSRQKEDKGHITTTSGDSIRLFVGTQAEYEELEDKSNLFAILTDDPNISKLNTLVEMLSNEIERAKDAEVSLNTKISDEVKRAKEAEAKAVQQKSYSTKEYTPDFLDGDCARAYVRSRNNTEDSILVSKYTKSHSIPIRNQNGNLFTLTPTTENECANKQYVDSLEKSLKDGNIPVKYASSSSKATYDENGNRISSAYLPRNEYVKGINRKNISISSNGVLDLGEEIEIYDIIGMSGWINAVDLTNQIRFDLLTFSNANDTKKITIPMLVGGSPCFVYIHMSFSSGDSTRYIYFNKVESYNLSNGETKTSTTYTNSSVTIYYQ